MEREIRARLPYPVRPGLTVEAGRFVLLLPKGDASAFEAASRIVDATLATIDALAVLPGEVEEILAISARERLKWTKDGRLRSAGTKTVKLRGRAKAVTFHVHDPRHVEDVLDRDLPTIWREEDAQAKAEARRRGAGKAARTRAAGAAPVKAAPRKAGTTRQTERTPDLSGWDAFAAQGLLR